MKVIQRRTSALFGQVSSLLRTLSQEAGPEEVHRLRTSARRLESVIALVHPQITPKQKATLKDLAELRRRAGKIRDCDIQLQLLEQVASSSARADRDIVAKALRERRRKQADRLITAAGKFRDSKSPYRFGKVAAAVCAKARLMESDRPMEDATAALEALRHEDHSRDGDSFRRLHALRLRLKKIRYTAELARSSEKQKKFVSDLKTVQDEIGRWHDWESLAEIARRKFPDRPNCSLLAQINALRASHLQSAVVAVSQLLQVPAPARKGAKPDWHPQRRAQTVS